MNFPEVRNYNLTIPKLEKWADANRALIPYQVSLGDKIATMADPPKNLPHTMDAMATWTRANYPIHVRLIERAGITLKEYFILNFALAAATGAASALERGVKIPPDVVINQANVQFVKTNKEKIMAMQAEFQQLLVRHK